MQDYKRLTNNNLEEYNPEYDFCTGCKYFGEPNGCNRPNGTCGNYERFIETYNRLAELEDKIENGTLIEISCKVGDTVYQFDNGGEIYESKIRSIYYVENTLFYDCGFFAFDNTAIGQSIFLTKAEAEAKLRELKGK